MHSTVCVNAMNERFCKIEIKRKLLSQRILLFILYEKEEKSLMDVMENVNKLTFFFIFIFDLEVILIRESVFEIIQFILGNVTFSLKEIVEFDFAFFIMS